MKLRIKIFMLLDPFPARHEERHPRPRRSKDGYGSNDPLSQPEGKPSQKRRKSEEGDALLFSQRGEVSQNPEIQECLREESKLAYTI